jgi:hypothetical protein|nr:MAG TPA: hypothetical protein [Caudoviricetes sp.]
MKNQVTSIEQSRRLIGLGVPAEKASMGWFEEMECNAAEEWQVPTGKKWVGERDNVSKPDNAVAPAFTVADLLEKVLPNVIQTKHNTYELTLSAMAGGGWRFYYQPALTEFETDDIGDEMNDDLIALLCDRVEWLLSNGYKLEA